MKDVITFLTEREIKGNKIVLKDYPELFNIVGDNLIRLNEFLESHPDANINILNNKGESLLSHTTNIEMVKRLIELNIKQDIIDRNGNTPFIVNAFYHRIDIMKLLINVGADINARYMNGGSKETALMFACSGANSDIVEFLVKKGADVNLQSYNGNTALFFCFYNRLEKKNIKILLDNGADINIKNNKGETVYDYALEKTKDKKILELLKPKAYID